MATRKTSSHSRKEAEALSAEITKRVVKSLIDQSFVTSKEAKTLPTFAQVKKAFPAAAKEVANNIKNQALQLAREVHKTLGRPLGKKANSHGATHIYDMASKLDKTTSGIAVLTAWAKRFEQPEYQETFYASALKSIIGLRRGSQEPFGLTMEDTHRLTTDLDSQKGIVPLAKQLPKRTTAPFKKRKLDGGAPK